MGQNISNCSHQTLKGRMNEPHMSQHERSGTFGLLNSHITSVLGVKILQQRLVVLLLARIEKFVLLGSMAFREASMIQLNDLQIEKKNILLSVMLKKMQSCMLPALEFPSKIAQPM